MALAGLAAEKEKPGSTIPSTDAIAAIDDALSMATNVEFYGKKTKTYRKYGDSKSGSFCTLPVRYDFANKATRIACESVLRDRCKTVCATPYHPTLRECIKQTVTKVREFYPDSAIRVVPDPHELGLRISKKDLKIEGAIWQDWDKLIKLPDLAMEIDIKQVPESLQVEGLELLTPRKLTTRKSRREAYLRGKKNTDSGSTTEADNESNDDDMDGKDD